MDDLVRWLRARLDEDAGRAAQWHDLECEIHARLGAGLVAAVAVSQMLTEVPGAVCDCDGPGRTLREIEAKRQVVARYEFAGAEAARLAVAGEEHGVWVQVAGALQSCVLQLALPYADRPGYRDEWRP